MLEKVRMAYSDMANAEALLSCYDPIAIYDPFDPKRPKEWLWDGHGIGSESMCWFGSKIIHTRQIHDIPGAGASMQSIKYLPKFPNYSYFINTGQLYVPDE